MNKQIAKKIVLTKHDKGQKHENKMIIINKTRMILQDSLDCMHGRTYRILKGTQMTHYFDILVLIPCFQVICVLLIRIKERKVPSQMRFTYIGTIIMFYSSTKGEKMSA